MNRLDLASGRRGLSPPAQAAVFCVASTMLAATLAAAESGKVVTLTIEEQSGIARRGEPVAAGVPLPQGMVTDVETLGLADEEGRPVRAHFTPANRWVTDGSLKWVHVHFRSDVASRGKRTLTLLRGKETASPPSPLRVEDESGRVTVVTGPLKFSVRKRGFNGIAEAWFDGSGKQRFNSGNRIIAPHSGGLTMRAAGKVYSSRNDDSSRITIEERTPLYVVLRADGVLATASGDKGFSYRSRLTAYAGQPKITAQVTFTNTMGPRREDAVPLEMLAWEIPTGLEYASVAIGGEKSIYRQPRLRKGETAWIHQSSSDMYTVGGVLEGAGNGKSSKPLTTGWAGLATGGRGFAAGVRWFWQLYPKGIEAEADGKLSLQLYPGRSQPLDIYTGVSRTHDVMFVFHGGKTAESELSDAFAAFQQPLRAFAPASWYCRETKAFGNLVEADPARFGARADVLDKYLTWWTANFDNIKQSREGRSIRGVTRDAYGLLEFGDGFHHVWQPGNPEPRNLAWDGNYYDFPHASLLHFLLTGRRDFFNFFVEHSRHMADVHFVHHDPDPRFIGSNRYCPPTDHVRMDPPRGDFRKAEVYVSDTFNHHKTLSLFESYLLTADCRALDVALSGLRYAFEYTRADESYSQPRGPGNQMLTLMAGYEFTGDRKYLERCNRIIEFGRAAQARNGGAFAPRSGQYFQVGITLEALVRYHELTGDESVIPMIGAALDFFIAKKYSFSNCAFAAGFMHRKTGNRSYLDYAVSAATKGGLFDNPVKNTGLGFRSTPYFLPYLVEQ